MDLKKIVCIIFLSVLLVINNSCKISKTAEEWNKEGEDFYKGGKSFEALKCYEEALKIDPKFTRAWDNKAHLVVRSNSDYQEALNCYEKVLAYDPENIEILISKGDIFIFLKKIDDAAVCYDKAMAINPKRADVWSAKALPLVLAKNYAEALKCYDKALELDPNRGTGIISSICGVKVIPTVIAKVFAT